MEHFVSLDVSKSLNCSIFILSTAGIGSCSQLVDDSLSLQIELFQDAYGLLLKVGNRSLYILVILILEDSYFSGVAFLSDSIEFYDSFYDKFIESIEFYDS